MITPWHVSVLTLFPDHFPGILGASIIGRARDEGRWRLNTVDLREFGKGTHRKVDDTPSGGGPGMILRADVVADAIDQVSPPGDPRPRICLSARGERLTQARVRALAKGPGAVFLCGRFEGIDERAIQSRGLEEVTIGDFVLAGGEVAAMTVIEACVRLLPGVMGDARSAGDESFEDGLLEYPQYTRPKTVGALDIPPVLMSGDHAAIAAWRQAEAERITRKRRPDLWAAHRKKPGPTGDFRGDK